MAKDILTYNGTAYQLSTINIDGMFETMIFPIENGVVSGNEVYCFRTFNTEKYHNKHKDIYFHPEKYLSKEALLHYELSKLEDYIGTIPEEFLRLKDLHLD